MEPNNLVRLKVIERIDNEAIVLMLFPEWTFIFSVTIFESYYQTLHESHYHTRLKFHDHP